MTNVDWASATLLSPFQAHVREQESPFLQDKKNKPTFQHITKQKWIYTYRGQKGGKIGVVGGKK